MPRVNIYFTENTFNQLREYIIRKHGSHRALSITVQEAVKEYLESKAEGKKDKASGHAQY